jgi:hypothetical protein
LQGQIRDDVRRYARLVIESDWAAMARNTDINDPVYDRSDGILVGLIDRLALEQARAGATPGVGPLLMQLVEARTARLARITLSDAGVTMAQWLGMLLIACAALAAIALCHNHHFGMQALAMTLYAIAASSAFFVVLAHDRPFVGGISVSSAPLHHLAPR